jgi:hypothetical protein
MNADGRAFWNVWLLLELPGMLSQYDHANHLHGVQCQAVLWQGGKDTERGHQVLPIL